MIRTLILSISLFLTSLSVAHAHPHIIVSYATEVVFNEKGEMIGLNHAWTFDKGYSAFLAQGLDTNKDKKLSREELAPMAKVNVESLREFDFFTYTHANGKALEWLEAQGEYMLENPVPESTAPTPAGTNPDPLEKIANLTLHFFLPLKAPLQTKAQNITLKIYDKTYLVAFVPDEKNPLKLGGNNKADCKTIFQKPKEIQAKPIYGNENQFVDQQKSQSFAARFLATTALVCP